MSDPKYNKYKGTVRFDDDNIVDIDLQPDTENITVLLNGEEVTGGGGDLPEVDSGDNGKVLTVVEGEWAAATQTAELPAVSGADNGNVLTVVSGSWAKAAPASQLPAVSGTDNGNVLTVVEGAWAKAAPSGGIFYIEVVYDTSTPPVLTCNKTFAQIKDAFTAGLLPIVIANEEGSDWKYAFPLNDLTITDDPDSLSSQFFSFMRVQVEQSGVQSLMYVINYDNSIDTFEGAYPDVGAQ